MAPIVGSQQTEELRVSNREEDSMNNEPSLSGKTIVGLIIPPPDIRNIVDKTALFVARNGIDFENKIKEKESTNVRFNFLSPTDPYHAYYKNKVVEYETGVPAAGMAGESVSSKLPDAVREHIEKVEFIPKNPPKPNEFTADPSTINAFDLDLIRLTALFVARNGRQFLTQLMNREARNYQFDFLKPQHSNFQYFTKLVEQYTKVIIPSKNIVQELCESANQKKILMDMNYRVGWEKHQRNIKNKEDAEVERERLAYNQIDWHDFVVVQTVDLQPSETLNLPPLCTPKDVGARILLQQRSEAAKAAAESVAMEMESDSEEEGEEVEADEQATELQDKLSIKDTRDSYPLKNAYEVTQPVPAAPTASSVVIRDYDPKKGRTNLASKSLVEDYIVSPLTGERIPARKLQEHVRFNTVDPQYKEQRDREQMERQDDDPTNASGTEISRNIAKLAERRTDIFGVGEQGAQQTIIGKKLGEEEHIMPRSDPKTIWDGQQSTIDATTRAAQQAITLDQQIIEIQRQHGFQPDPARERIGPKDTAIATTTAAVPLTIASAQPLPATTAPTTTAPVVNQLPPVAPRPTIGSNVARIIPVSIKPPLPTAMIPPQPPMGSGIMPTAMPTVPIIPQVVVQNNLFHSPIATQNINVPPPPPPALPIQANDDGAPPSKRARPEEALESEEQWLQKVSGTIDLSVMTPPTLEWNLNGKIFRVSLDITSQVSALKLQVQEQTGVPSSKQKLVYEGFFMKDNFTLAYYNIANNGSIQLQIKERGGRKK